MKPTVYVPRTVQHLHPCVAVGQSVVWFGEVWLDVNIQYWLHCMLWLC